MKILSPNQNVSVLSLCLCLAISGLRANAQQSTTAVPTSADANQAALLTLDDALRLADKQTSIFQLAGLNERSAAEDLKQAQAAFLPHVSAPLSYLYTSPALGQPPPGSAASSAGKPVDTTLTCAALRPRQMAGCWRRLSKPSEELSSALADM